MEANRIGCDIVGCDINPMAYWIVRQEIEHLDLDAYREAAGALRSELERDIGHLYRTTCLGCGTIDAHVKYFLWVKVIPCTNCAREIRLFPGYLLAQDRRHPRNVFVCAECGALNESESRTHPGTCGTCGSNLRPDGPAKRGRCVCPACSTTNTFPDATKGPPRHALFAIEYTCPACKDSHQGRFFKQPDADDLARVAGACDRWARTRARFVPTDEIPTGDESDRLHRWGYRHYHEMFNERQLLGLELSCRRIEAVKDERVRNALATNLSDLLRYWTIGAGHSLAELDGLTDNDNSDALGWPTGDLVVSYRNTTDDLEIYKNGVLDADETVLSGLPDPATTMRIDYMLNDFNAGSTVNYAVYFDDSETPLTSGSFTWDADNRNYLSVGNNLSGPAKLDNFEIRLLGLPPRGTVFSFR